MHKDQNLITMEVLALNQPKDSVCQYCEINYVLTGKADSVDGLFTELKEGDSVSVLLKRLPWPVIIEYPGWNFNPYRMIDNKMAIIENDTALVAIYHSEDMRNLSIKKECLISRSVNK